MNEFLKNIWTVTSMAVKNWWTAVGALTPQSWKDRAKSTYMKVKPYIKPALLVGGAITAIALLVYAPIFTGVVLVSGCIIFNITEVAVARMRASYGKVIIWSTTGVAFALAALAYAGCAMAGLTLAVMALGGFWAFVWGTLDNDDGRSFLYDFGAIFALVFTKIFAIIGWALLAVAVPDAIVCLFFALLCSMCLWLIEASAEMKTISGAVDPDRYDLRQSPAASDAIWIISSRALAFALAAARERQARVVSEGGDANA